MKKILFKMMCIIVISLMLTGCLTIEQRKEKKNIEKEVKQIMIDYLQDNYNINKVDNVNAEYTLTGDIAESQFKGTVTGRFRKGGQSYQILCDYDNKKCYDSFSYIKKVNPILTNYIKSILDKYSSNNITKPDYIKVDDMHYDLDNYLDDNSYGFFNNYDTVNTYEDVVNYYDVRSIEIIYNGSDKIIENNTTIFEKLSEEIKLFIEVNVYNQSVIKEHFRGDIESNFVYYINEIFNIGDFTAYWHVKEASGDNYGKIEQGDFEIELINNNYYFDEKIELYGREYILYSPKILEVRDISNNEDLHYLYLELNEEVCDSKSAIVYKKNSDYHEVIYNVSFASGMYETKIFAIYCKK